MYGLWILFIIFAAITAGAFMTPVITYRLYKHYKKQTKFIRNTSYGTKEIDYYEGYHSQRKEISKEELPKYETAYKRMKFWDKFDDNSFIFYIIGTLACIAAVILFVCAIFIPLSAADNVAYWSEFAPMVENLVDNSSGYQDVGMTNKIVEYNSWLARARSSQEIYGNWSSYYNIDLSQLEYIKIGQ